MRCDKIIKIIEDWAPKSIAWEKDNVGLQIGSLRREVKNILLCLDVDEKVVDEANRKNCNLIISHHPLLFRSLKKLDTDRDRKSRIIEKLIKKDITLYSAHTNLDFTKDGVSFQLAKKLKLTNQKFLLNLSSNQNKLIVFVPNTHADKVLEAMHNAGAGIIGEYSNCSFRTLGTGTFKGSEKSNPVLGLKGNLEKVEEVKIEVLTNSFDLKKVIAAMKKVHPYEEVAYDVYPLVNENVNYGIGVIGELKQPLSDKEFLTHISKSLGIKNFRYSRGSKSKIKKVAVCGGSCSDLIETAIQNNADAFVTADIKYHTFQDAENEIMLVDAGHYETEIPSLDELKNRIEKSYANKIKVFKYSGSTNPIVFYNN
ncbi:MAG TPA: Nif3-like dinuclear metal center hexameric protein [Ignavibacteriaceae bacterium]|nr:Nif3-like dinuclear metal center hexameric protein [Ignavibacteriaceae bacterium]